MQSLPRRGRRAVLAVASPLFMLAPALAGVGNTSPASPEVLAADTAAYRQHETTISNPFFEGRAPGTKGNRLAADYVEWNYKRLGLLPAFPSEVGPEGTVSAGPRVSYRQVFKAPPSQRPGDSLKLISQAASYSLGGADR